MWKNVSVQTQDWLDSPWLSLRTKRSSLHNMSQCPFTVWTSANVSDLSVSAAEADSWLDLWQLGPLACQRHPGVSFQFCLVSWFINSITTHALCWPVSVHLFHGTQLVLLSLCPLYLFVVVVQWFSSSCSDFKLVTELLSVSFSLVSLYLCYGIVFVSELY